MDLEDLEADVAAAITGANVPQTKITKKLSQLSNREVTYIPFRKDFYVEVPELARLTDEEVSELRESLENIKVVGKGCPKPVTCWAQCGLSRKVMSVLKKLNFAQPTPVQAQAIPAIMSGRDLIGIAKTGCGKTMSFLLPMFRHIADQPKLERGEGPIGLVITPTRELATQICEDATKFTKTLGIRCVSVYGGPNISKQIAQVKTGAEIVVCTPGRMIEILTVNSGRVINLSRCTFLVLDEADRLFDMGFEKQIRSIVDLIRPDRQTVMFSATFPKIMEAHARRIMTKPIEVQVGGRSVVCKDVAQTVEIIEEDDKFPKLIEILQKHVDDHTSAIVFTSKQEKADSLLEDLMQNYDSNCLVLHGGIDKDDRISTFASFKSGYSKVLVATSVAARGLDVKNCICVVNYDVPNHYEDYVHRCGRTGRAGNKGFAYTFLTPDQGQYTSDIIKALQLSGNEVPDNLQKLWDTYKEEAERLGKRIWQSSGFAGKGFKFDEAEAQLVNEKKKYQKKSLGLDGSDEEEDEEIVDAEKSQKDREVDSATLVSEIKNLTGNKTAIISRPVIRKFGAKADEPPLKEIGAPAVVPVIPVPVIRTDFLKSSLSSKVDLAKQRATLILARKRGLEGNSDAADKRSITAGIARQIAEQRAQALTARLAGTSHVIPAICAVAGQVDQSSVAQAASSLGAQQTNPAAAAPVKQRLEIKFEINDYHQQVRRTLTSKEALGRICERCDVGITVKGMYCQPGDRPIEPKLHLAIEGSTEEELEMAHRDLLVLVKDEYTRINSQPAKGGRYKLL